MPRCRARRTSFSRPAGELAGAISEDRRLRIMSRTAAMAASWGRLASRDASGARVASKRHRDARELLAGLNISLLRRYGSEE